VEKIPWLSGRFKKAKAIVDNTHNDENKIVMLTETATSTSSTSSDSVTNVEANGQQKV
jgi:hypothetical protein